MALTRRHHFGSRWFLIGAARNEAYGWDTYFAYLLDARIAIASYTLAITFLAMIIGVSALMRYCACRPTR